MSGRKTQSGKTEEKGTSQSIFGNGPPPPKDPPSKTDSVNSGNKIRDEKHRNSGNQGGGDRVSERGNGLENPKIPQKNVPDSTAVTQGGRRTDDGQIWITKPHLVTK